MAARPLASLTQHRKRRRHQDDDEKLADLDAYIKGEERPAQCPPRQLHFTQDVGESEPVNEAERERNQAPHIAAVLREKVVGPDVDDAQRNRRLNQPRRRRDDVQRRERQRDAVGHRERRDDDQQLTDRSAKQQQADEEQEVVWPDEDVMGTRRNELFDDRKYPLSRTGEIVDARMLRIDDHLRRQRLAFVDVDERLVHPAIDYFAGTRQGVLAVVKKFIPAGAHHILIGPDHLLFLVGLLLLGGSIRQLLIVVTSFTVAHSITLSLAALNIVTPPARLIEPAIALSIVYVGADNLLAQNGRDVRGLIAFTFGFIHGFGFANVLREMELPRRALGWSLFSFNIGVEIGQLFVVVLVATAFTMLRQRSEWSRRHLAFAGSIVVIAAGAFWFVQRVFFPGGLS